ncbi:MAG: ankyrin repeat domain-containing protein [bacterium]|nr:ankyrin repeat domain-containing protein [bacterium]
MPLQSDPTPAGKPDDVPWWFFGLCAIAGVLPSLAGLARFGTVFEEIEIAKILPRPSGLVPHALPLEPHVLLPGILLSTFPTVVIAMFYLWKGKTRHAALFFLVQPVLAGIVAGVDTDLQRVVSIVYFLSCLVACQAALFRPGRSLGLAALALLVLMIQTVLGWGPVWLESRLLEAAASGRTTEVERLLRWRVDPNCTDRDGETPLMEAVEAGSEETVELLLRHGALPHQRDRHGRSAMTRAIESGSSELTVLLLGPAREGGAGAA